LLAAQTDFTEAGELMLFIDESQVAFLEDMMWEQGFLDARQMAGAFQLLRSNDLIWSRILHDYLMGERAEITPMMAWNADATRMPYRMHSEYLRRLFLNNDLAEGRYASRAARSRSTTSARRSSRWGPEKDHIAPWRSVHKVHLFTDADVTFVLAPGGHNRGIVSPPGDSRGFRMRTTPHDSVRLEPEAWADLAEPRDGLVVDGLDRWLAERNQARRSIPRARRRRGRGRPAARRAGPLRPHAMTARVAHPLRLAARGTGGGCPSGRPSAAASAGPSPPASRR
jgi:polyhydroxyalkanoate synthase